jgi:hypothetical protein
MLGRPSAAVTFAHGLAIEKVVHAFVRSAQKGAWVSVA